MLVPHLEARTSDLSFRHRVLAMKPEPHEPLVRTAAGERDIRPPAAEMRPSVVVPMTEATRKPPQKNSTCTATDGASAEQCHGP